ncbi:uncharacterized protein Z520_11582 [Fonsecaea multimorphosa CBS 102226]|uniref:Transcription factor domain-containing protein n=1 Tax=Fonsecaea multimorphosa CBS 102226 TaxID=1442371 RepID=A0A0D2GTD0_9EURO|nr:uncharacterized protein Z520_11582 [Fonsecaea multimorphosa CBS 102226]KIX92730.1 hypothetical protein Z520_11582 [Fonsecaea multimorphosa CBS 102226]OAL17972.1 hypothetical protein AYO22_11128 [Fonsecaea multimorphosa]
MGVPKAPGLRTSHWSWRPGPSDDEYNSGRKPLYLTPHEHQKTLYPAVNFNDNSTGGRKEQWLVSQENRKAVTLAEGERSEQCEGYERYPVFINRNQAGLQRRERLEEVRCTRPQSALQNQDSTRITFSVPSPSQLIEDQLLSCFWEGYSTDSSQHSGAREPAWLYHSINISGPTTSLRQALLSLAYIRTGRLQSNQTLILKGQEIYGQTLRLMQSALYDSTLVLHDETLAAARCMVLYEAFESTSEDMDAWQSHIMGIARIIQLRGPGRHRDPLSKSILESMRYNAMIVCLARRESSFFSNPDWLLQPWADDTPKDIEQRIYDYGFTLSNLIQMGEAAYQRSDRAEILRILEQIRNSYVGMTALHEELLAMQPEHYPLAAHHHVLLAIDERPFGETTHAITCAILLALDLFFSTYAAALIDKCADFLSDGHEHGYHDSLILAGISRYTDPARRLDLARQILRLLQYCLQTTPFEYARPRIIFPLNVVRWELRTIPQDRAQVQALFDTIASANQFRIARSVQNAGSKTLPSVVSWRRKR